MRVWQLLVILKYQKKANKDRLKKGKGWKEECLFLNIFCMFNN